jgi:ribosome-binding protein aMBF1 (putative translation factor)
MPENEVLKYMKNSRLPLKKILQRKLKDAQFRFHFDESRSISDLCLAVAGARHAMGLSQIDLAKKTDTTQSVIARLENGNQGRMPSLELLGRVATALGLNLIVVFEKKKAA